MIPSRVVYVTRDYAYDVPGDPPEPRSGATEWHIVDQTFHTRGVFVVWRCWLVA